MTTRAESNRGNTDLDLVLTRDIDVPRELVWEAWTNPRHLEKWWTPAPWTTEVLEFEPRPGGSFRTMMRGPEGEEHDNRGAFLEVVENERIVFTDAVGPGYRPAKQPFMTAVITLEDHAGGTRYTARVLHKDEADRDKHEKMGFFEGWGTCIEQLAAVARELGRSR